MDEHDDSGADEQQNSPGVIYTIGVGDMALEHLSRRLEVRDVQVLIDVRSPPFAIRRMDVMPEPLEEFIKARGIKYLNLSEQLGDRPQDIGLRIKGRVSYRKYRELPRVESALWRLVRAYEQGFRVAILDREDDPALSFRARCIGAWLHAHGIAPRHLTRHDAFMTQEEVVSAIARMKDSVDWSVS